MRLPKFASPLALALPLSPGSASVMAAPESPPAIVIKDASVPTAESLLNQILRDPFVPEYIRQSTFTPALGRQRKELSFELRRPAPYAAEMADILHVFPRGNGTFDLMCWFTSEELEADEPADWKKVQQQADAFVAKYFPGLTRREAIRGAAHSGAGRVIEYSQMEQEVLLKRVTLTIHPVDGKLRRIETRTEPIARQASTIAPQIAREQLLAAAKTALTAKGLPTAGLEINIAQRLPNSYRGNRPGFFYSMALSVPVEKQKYLRIVGEYDEQTRKFVIEKSETIPVTTAPEKTVVFEPSDSTPLWSQDGRTVYWLTDRPTKKLARNPITSPSIAIWQAESKQEPRLMRFLKPVGLDETSYSVQAAHGKWLVVAVSQNVFAIVDTEQGHLHIPTRDPAWIKQTDSSIPAPILARLNDNFIFSPRGVQWLVPGETLLASHHFSGNTDLFLFRKTSAAPGYTWDFKPIFSQLGADIRPSINPQQTLVAWGHQLSQDTEASWELCIGSLNLEVPEITGVTRVPLNGEPRSITYVHPGKWLILTESGLQWGEKQKDTIKLTLVPALTCKSQALEITGVSASPDGQQIILSARFKSTEDHFMRTEFPIPGAGAESLYRWDGKSTTVHPWLSANKQPLDRFEFSGTGKPWTLVAGNKKTAMVEQLFDNTTIQKTAQ